MWLVYWDLDTILDSSDHHAWTTTHIRLPCNPNTLVVDLWPIRKVQIHFSNSESRQCVERMLLETLIGSILSYPVQKVENIHLMLIRYAFQEVFIRGHESQEDAQDLYYFNEEVLIVYLVSMFKFSLDIPPDQERFPLLGSLTKHTWLLLMEEEGLNEFANQLF